jgi:hypothetical protein
MVLLGLKNRYTEGGALLQLRGMGRRFWILWSASSISNLGDGIRLAALPLWRHLSQEIRHW